MTPFGHIGSGLLIAGIAEQTIAKGDLSLEAIGIMAALSMLPDLDAIVSFAFKKMRPGKQRLNHHSFPTHTPIFYLFLSIMAWINISGLFAVFFLILTFTHLLLDTWGTDDGIMWLWPLNNKQYSIYPTDLHEGGVFGVQYYRQYMTRWHVSIPEVLLFVGGLALVIV
jgi:hypothetical protein